MKTLMVIVGAVVVAVALGYGLVALLNDVTFKKGKRK